MSYTKRRILVGRNELTRIFLGTFHTLIWIKVKLNFQHQNTSALINGGNSTSSSRLPKSAWCPELILWSHDFMLQCVTQNRTVFLHCEPKSLNLKSKNSNHYIVSINLTALNASNRWFTKTQNLVHLEISSIHTFGYHQRPKCFLGTFIGRILSCQINTALELILYFLFKTGWTRSAWF